MSDISSQPMNQDIYSYGFDKGLNIKIELAENPLVYDSFLDRTEAQLIQFGALGVGNGTNNFRVDPKSGLWLGADKFADAPFRVSLAGALVATNVTLTGAITASSGTIGGFTIGAATLSTVGVTLDSDSGGGSPTITATNIQTGSTSSRITLNANTLTFYPSSGGSFMVLSNGNSEIDITHEGTAAAIDIDYKASGARGTNLIHLQDANQISGASTDATVLFVDRTSASSSAKNLVDIFNAGGTGTALDIRQNSTAGNAALRIYQQDVSETAVFIGTSTAATEADIGLLEVNPATAGTVGIYIAPGANVAHMRWFAGSAPASPVDGDYWYDGTNLKIRVGGTTKTIAFV